MKQFCTAGPIESDIHYYLPERLDWARFDAYIKNRLYFIIHAPRQSGKTTGIKQYMDYLNKKGEYTAFYISFEPAHNKPTVAETFFALLENFQRSIKLQLPHEEKALAYLEKLLQTNVASHPNAFLDFLTFWAQASAKPLVLFFDEVDGLTGDSLISFFKQVRTGFPERRKNFPYSIGIVGVRDLRDYKVRATKDCNQPLSESPFNITAESVRLADFTKDDIQTLYNQHTAATGQLFTPEAIELVFCLTQGQPWLVNALASEACFKDVTDRTKPITKEVIDRARKVLIIRRDTHLDSLLDRLNDKRVIAIIDAIMSGKEGAVFNDNDVQYVRDLGLIKVDDFKIANPIYQEIIPRSLTSVLQTMITDKIHTYLDQSGALIMDKLLIRFTQWYQENSCNWFTQFESGPHMLLMAFLDRLVNGGGDIQREFALGSRKADLVVFWKSQRIIIEVKLYRSAETIPQGLVQTADYMDYCHNSEGHLVVFDRDPDKTWQEKVSHHYEIIRDKKIGIWQM